MGQPRRAAIPSLVVYTMGVPGTYHTASASRGVAAADAAKICCKSGAGGRWILVLRLVVFTPRCWAAGARCQRCAGGRAKPAKPASRSQIWTTHPNLHTVYWRNETRSSLAAGGTSRVVSLAALCELVCSCPGSGERGAARGSGGSTIERQREIIFISPRIGGSTLAMIASCPTLQHPYCL